METPEYADLLIGQDNHILTVTLNRPHRKNALRPQTVTELIHALERAEGSDEVRVVVLTGQGDIFCSGGDLKGGGGKGDKESPLPIDPGGFPKLCLLLEGFAKPIVAMTDGGALAGGMGLMMACHISLAAENARFGTPEITRGLWPMMIMRPLFACMPRKKAIDLILTGRIIDAAEAESLGIITRAVKREKLHEEAYALAGLLAQYSPAIMRLGLNAMNEQFKMGSEEAFPFLDTQLRECMKTEDFKEGILAFAQKRKPVFKGK